VLGFVIPFTLAAIVTPVQIGVGDWAAQFLAHNQPVKLAAIEGLYETRRGAPLTVGGIPVDASCATASRFLGDCRCSPSTIRTPRSSDWTAFLPTSGRLWASSTSPSK
jgi:hypothetical protein